MVFQLTLVQLMLGCDLVLDWCSPASDEYVSKTGLPNETGSFHRGTAGNNS